MGFFSYLVAKELPGSRLSPLVLKEERERRTRWLSDYSFSNMHCKTLPRAAMSAMQYSHALEHLIREVVLADQALGPVHVLKADVSDGFYHIVLRPTDAPKMGIVIIL